MMDKKTRKVVYQWIEEHILVLLSHVWCIKKHKITYAFWREAFRFKN